MCQKPGGRQMPDPRAVPTLLMPHPRGLQGTQMPRSCPGGGWAQLELTDALERDLALPGAKLVPGLLLLNFFVFNE